MEAKRDRTYLLTIPGRLPGLNEYIADDLGLDAEKLGMQKEQELSCS